MPTLVPCHTHQEAVRGVGRPGASNGSRPNAVCTSQFSAPMRDQDLATNTQAYLLPAKQRMALSGNRGVIPALAVPSLLLASTTNVASGFLPPTTHISTCIHDKSVPGHCRSPLGRAQVRSATLSNPAWARLRGNSRRDPVLARRHVEDSSIFFRTWRPCVRWARRGPRGR